MFSLFSVSLVQINLSLELFENRIFVRGPSDLHLEFSVRKPNCSNCDTFENRGLTVYRFDIVFLFCPLLSNLFSMYADLGKNIMID